MVIDEDKIRRIVNEALGIARNVVNITNIIENKIIEIYDLSDGSEDIDTTFNVNDLKVVFKHYYVDNDSDLEKYDFVNGYSYKENTLYLTYGSVRNKTFDLNLLIDTIQHEVEHYWQCKNASKGFYTSKYKAIIDGKKSENRFLSCVCTLFYFNNRFEIDAYVNGAYNILRKLNCDTYKEFIEQTDLKNLLNLLSYIEETIKTTNSSSQSFLIAKNYIKKNNVFKRDFTNDNLLKVLNRVRNYLYEKIGKAWVYYVEERSKGFTNEEIEKMNSVEKKLYYASKHSRKMKLEGRKNDLLY